eukprot:scaffold10364_cov61-Attheya_sp.AAC.6
MSQKSGQVSTRGLGSREESGDGQDSLRNTSTEESVTVLARGGTSLKLLLKLIVGPDPRTQKRLATVRSIQSRVLSTNLPAEYFDLRAACRTLTQDDNAGCSRIPRDALGFTVEQYPSSDEEDIDILQLRPVPVESDVSYICAQHSDT